MLEQHVVSRLSWGNMFLRSDALVISFEFRPHDATTLRVSHLICRGRRNAIGTRSYAHEAQSMEIGKLYAVSPRKVWPLLSKATGNFQLRVGETTLQPPPSHDRPWIAEIEFARCSIVISSHSKSKLISCGPTRLFSQFPRNNEMANPKIWLRLFGKPPRDPLKFHTDYVSISLHCSLRSAISGGLHILAFQVGKLLFALDMCLKTLLTSFAFIYTIFFVNEFSVSRKYK